MNADGTFQARLVVMCGNANGLRLYHGLGFQEDGPSYENELEGKEMEWVRLKSPQEMTAVSFMDKCLAWCQQKVEKMKL